VVPLLHHELRAGLVERAAVLADGSGNFCLQGLLCGQSLVASALLSGKPKSVTETEQAEEAEKSDNCTA